MVFRRGGDVAENRAKVREAIRTATPTVKAFLRLGEEDGKTVWWWQRLVLVARKR